MPLSASAHLRLIFMVMLLLIIPKDVSAFFIPSSLQILGTSIANILTGLLIMVGAVLVSFYITIRSRLKRRYFFMGVFMVLIVISGAVSLYREFSALEAMNIHEDDVRHKDIFRINTTGHFREEDAIRYGVPPYLDMRLEGESITLDSDIEDSFDNITRKLLEDYEFDEVCLIRDCIYLPEDCEDHRDKQECILEAVEIRANRDVLFIDPLEVGDEATIIGIFAEERLHDLGIYFQNYVQEDNLVSYLDRERYHDLMESIETGKVIFMCHQSSTGRKMAEFGRDNGYENIYYAGIREITAHHGSGDDGFSESSIIIDMYRNSDSDSKDVYIRFDSSVLEEELREIKTRKDELFDDERISIMEEDEFLEWWRTDDHEAVNLICSTRLGCTFLQYFIHSNNLSIEKVYSILPH